MTFIWITELCLFANLWSNTLHTKHVVKLSEQALILGERKWEGRPPGEREGLVSLNTRGKKLLLTKGEDFLCSTVLRTQFRPVISQDLFLISGFITGVFFLLGLTGSDYHGHFKTLPLRDHQNSLIAFYMAGVYSDKMCWLDKSFVPIHNTINACFLQKSFVDLGQRFGLTQVSSSPAKINNGCWFIISLHLNNFSGSNRVFNKTMPWMNKHVSLRDFQRKMRKMRNIQYVYMQSSNHYVKSLQLWQISYS